MTLHHLGPGLLSGAKQTQILRVGWMSCGNHVKKMRSCVANGMRSSGLGHPDLEGFDQGTLQ